MSYMIIATFYLSLSRTNRAPNYLSAKIHQRRPKLAADEVCMELNVRVPSHLFEKPTLRANITLDSAKVPELTIDADMVDQLGQHLSEQLGIRVEVAFPEVPAE